MLSTEGQIDVLMEVYTVKLSKANFREMFFDIVTCEAHSLEFG